MTSDIIREGKINPVITLKICKGYIIKQTYNKLGHGYVRIPLKPSQSPYNKGFSQIYTYSRVQHLNPGQKEALRVLPNENPNAQELIDGVLI